MLNLLGKRKTPVGLAVFVVALCVTLSGCGDDGAQKNSRSSAASASNAQSSNGNGDAGNAIVDAASWSAITHQSWPPGELAEGEMLAPDLTSANIAVVLDMSGSMSRSRCAGNYESKAQAARAVLKQWVQDVPDEVNLGLLAFSYGRTELLVPLGTHNRQDFVAETMAVQPAGNTPLRSALDAARKVLAKRARHQLGYGSYQIVMITDGLHSPGEDPVPVVKAILNNPANPIRIHTIGFCITGSVLNQPGLLEYTSASDPDQLAYGLSSVLAESTSFKPMESFDGK